MIYTVTLNPAVDKILFLEEFQRSKTSRLTRSLESIGGKGTHVSINLKLQGLQSIALGIALGENGRKIIHMLEDWGIEVRFLQYDLPGMDSRTNYEIVETSGRACTMLTERGPLLPKRITDDLLHQIKELVTVGDILVLTGDASNVEDATIYSKLVLAGQRLGAKVCLDASGHYLMEGLKSSPFLIKPNLDELSCVAGKDLKTEEDIIAAMRHLDDNRIEIIAMTWGDNGAMIKWGPDFYRILPTQLETVNEGGCGDAFLSAIIAGIEQHKTIEETLKTAAAIAAATAESELTVGYDPIRATVLIDQIKVQRLFEVSPVREGE